MRAIFLATCVWAITAGADTVTVIRGVDRIVYKHRTTIDITEHSLEGTPEKPVVIYTIDHRQARFDSLIRLRSTFLPELRKSVEQL